MRGGNFGALIQLLAVLALTACGNSGSAAANALHSSSSSLSGSSTPEERQCVDFEGASPGFYVQGDTLYDVTGKPFVMRGVNYPYAWYTGKDTVQQFADMASVGANTVRVVLSNGAQWNRVNGNAVSDIIRWSTANQLVVMLEVHDATGWPQNSSAANPRTAVEYWLADDIRDAIDGHENTVIINIANEPLGNFDQAEKDEENWIDLHAEAVAALRCGGLRHTLVVDAPNWGQDWTNTMRDGPGAEQIVAADPDSNVMFSVHMYDLYGQDEAVEDYFDRFLAKGLALIVGEFAADHGERGEVAVDRILALAQAHAVGYLGWSWSGNTTSGGLDSLDIVQDFDVQHLSSWGERLINGEHGLQATAQVCSCFLDDEHD